MKRVPLLPLTVCAVLTLINYALSVTAVGTKSATVDEPMHLAGAWSHVYLRDFHVNPEDPPLWNYLAMLPLGRDAFDFESTRGVWNRSLTNQNYASRWVHDIFASAESAGDMQVAAMIDRARRAMALAGALLVALSCAIAWRIAGATAAMAVGVLLAFDPLLLGHAPLIKNDVSLAVVTLVLAASVEALLKRVTAIRVLLVGLLCGAAAATKFSGVLLIPLTTLALLTGAVISSKSVRLRRVLIAILMSCGVALMSWVVIWLSYGLRFAPSGPMDREFFVQFVARRDLFRQLHREATNDEILAWKRDTATRITLWANEHRLLPNSYCMGLLFTHGSALTRRGFLLGEIRDHGWWYYFPVAFALKAPTATILAILIGIGVGAHGIAKRKTFVLSPGTIVFLCIGGGYFILAMWSHLNIGVRHLLPIVPLIYIAVAVAFTKLVCERRRIAVALATTLSVGLVVESLLAWPNYIAFFNAMFGGTRDGIHRLSDSNLDWGQDLPLLVDWQNRNPTKTLYVMYFGGVEPDSYHLRYTPLPGNSGERTQQTELHEPGVIAISATHLQGTYLPPELVEYYAVLRRIRPREVLGGTIYLYDYPPAR